MLKMCDKPDCLVTKSGIAHSGPGGRGEEEQQIVILASLSILLWSLKRAYLLWSLKRAYCYGV